MPRSAPTDRVVYARLLRRSRWLTAAASVPFAVLATELVSRALSDDPSTHASAAFVFFQLGLYSILAGVALWFTWRRSFRARPVVLAHDAQPGTVMGVPELDAPAGRHSTLSGNAEPPPRRW